ncbi:MAG: hypothetical protein NZ932_04705 [Candidatus Bathyarchaeota archaeon]|nr:hypothetical protein [Candidatus Bathyarchaeota archaeon]
MKVLIKRGSQSHILFWRPLKGKSFYPVNYKNIAFVGPIEEIRRKINALLQGAVSRVEFEAYYCRETKTLALWS